MKKNQALVVTKAIHDVSRLGLRAKRLATKLHAYGLPDRIAEENALTIVELTDAIAATLRAVPASWQPTKGSVGRPVGKGDKVTLTDKALKRFHGLVPKDETWTIAKVVGSKLLCVSTSGVTIPVTRPGVRRVES